MSASAKQRWWVCAKCGANVSPETAVCWYCHQGVRPATHDGQSPAAGQSIATKRAGVRTSTWVVTAALLVILVGAFLMGPGAGIIAAILIVPAFIRTCVSALRARSRGDSIGLGEHVSAFTGVFAVALAVVVLSVGVITISSGIALLARCMW